MGCVFFSTRARIGFWFGSRHGFGKCLRRKKLRIIVQKYINHESSPAKDLQIRCVRPGPPYPPPRQRRERCPPHRPALPATLCHHPPGGSASPTSSPT